jgi:hypothetical protein
MESFFGRFQREPVHQGICRPFFDVFLALVDGISCVHRAAAFPSLANR